MKFLNLKSAAKSGHPPSFGYAFMGIFIISQSVSTSFGKEIMSTLDPMTTLFFVSVISFIFTMLTFGCVPLIREFMELKADQQLPLLAVSLLSGVIAPILLFVGLEGTQAMNAELFRRASIVFLYLLAIFFLHERISRSQIIAVHIIVFGIIVVALRGFSESFRLSPADTMILLSAFCYSISSVIYKKKLSHIHPELLLVGSALCGIMCILALAPTEIFSFTSDFSDVPSHLLPSLIGFSIVARFLNQYSYYEAIEYLPVHTVALAMPLGMVGSMTFVYFYLGEVLMWYHLLGGLSILIGIFLIQLSHLHKSEEDIVKHVKIVHKQHV